MTAFKAVPIGPGRVKTGMPQATYATEAASQTGEIGGAVKIVAGLVTDVAAPATDTATIGIRATNGLNVATAVANKRAGYYPVEKGLRLRGSLVGALAESSRGTLVGLAIDATTGYLVFDAASTHKPFKVIGWPSTSVVGDTLAQVEVEAV